MYASNQQNLKIIHMHSASGITTHLIFRCCCMQSISKSNPLLLCYHVSPSDIVNSKNLLKMSKTRFPTFIVLCVCTCICALPDRLTFFITAIYSHVSTYIANCSMQLVCFHQVYRWIVIDLRVNFQIIANSA